jgi:ribosomal protein S18 acetylase RimI-like enzyme
MTIRTGQHEIFNRQLLPSDYDEYKRVRLDCLKQYPDNFGTTYEEELNATRLKLDCAIKKPDQSNFAFGAFNSGHHLIGICGFVAETRSKTQHRGEIVQMFVDPSYAGKGIGKALLKLSIEKAFANTQIEQIILSAVSSNTSAISLYKKLGFVEYGRLDNYFKSGSKFTSQSFLYLMKPF